MKRITVWILLLMFLPPLGYGNHFSPGGKQTGRPKVLPDKKSSPAVSTIFTDETESSGLDFRHYNGMTGQYYLPEIMGSGAALFDYDNDGDLDVFLVQGSVFDTKDKPDKTLFPFRGKGLPQSKLFRNDSSGEKNSGKRVRFTDVTEKSRILAQGYGMGAVTGDINNDGWTDLYVYNMGSNQMWLNNADGTFSDVTKKSATDDKRWSTGAAFFDYDRDGWLDLYVVNYLDFTLVNSPECFANTTARDYCGPKAFRPVPGSLFHNKGDSTFEDVSIASGITREYGSGLGVVSTDFNNDGWIDFYVANDGNPNQLWMNQKNGTFKNLALLGGAAVNRDGQSEAGMGVDAGDFNGDGNEDIFITHLMEETHTLYTSIGNGMFEDQTIEAKLGRQIAGYTGFGTLWFDYDNDGWLDLLSANGSVRTLPELAQTGEPYPFGQPNQLFHNTGKNDFVETSTEASQTFQLPEVSRGAAFGDIDNDGDTDIVITNNNGIARLYMNQLGNRNHWLGLKLTGGKNRRDMLGAKIEIVISKGKTLWRRVRTDGGYCSSHDARVLVGLGAANKVEMVRVHWVSGKIEVWNNPRINQYITLQEGSTAKSG